ncbi:acyl-CoA synthetase like protein [Zymoseptoria brevis]|uniref:Acyl-CoA synthetase like protein n=1 Tax=Zymoseptoria brevis TaxID=1047168 RepID=A0A0F4GM46_9PEZI|nr:acyl-CoA synthetase like protein [Zymoseptoria brevis]
MPNKSPGLRNPAQCSSNTPKHSPPASPTHLGPEAGRGDETAVFWHSEVAGRRENFTHGRLLREVETLAGVLRGFGVGKGDTVVIYMPMIAQALIAMLASARLGAVHAVVFGGFGAHALAQLRGALRMCKARPNKVLVWRRSELGWPDGIDESRSEVDWEQAVTQAARDGVTAECVPVRSEDPLYIIYTSGTTGAPKGVLRDNGGHAVGLLQCIRCTSGVRGPGDVSLGVSDIGWVTGHSFVLYGPLIAGSAIVLFEGKPVGTPDAGIVWRLVEEYKINIIFTAPTALRAIRRADQELTLLKEVGDRGGLRSLRALWLTGERSQPAVVETFQHKLDEYAVKGAIINDNWGLSEQGVPLSCTALIPAAGLDASNTEFIPGAAKKVIPGCAGTGMPGMDIHCVDDDGNGVPPGDAGLITEEGYAQIMSRSDDVINVAGHRLSTGAIEQAISAHPAVAKCCVIGKPDELKGHLPLGFVVTFSPQDERQLFKEVQALVREQQGSIASLGGIITAKQGHNLIPRTRSGKMLRRNLKEIVENAYSGEIEKEVNVPATIEDFAAIDIARRAIKAYVDSEQGPKAKL